jgi:hypothetical protein
VLAALCSGIAGAQERQLTTGVAGPIALGDSVDQIYARVGRENTRLVDLLQEGQFSPALEVTLPGAPVPISLVVVVREWPCPGFSAWGIQVRDPRFKTVDGLGVGSTVADIRSKYDVRIVWGEGDRVVVVEKLGLTFALAPTTGPESSWRVKSVWVIPQPENVRRTRCPQLGPLGGG